MAESVTFGAATKCKSCSAPIEWVKVAHELGVKCHIGRVGTARRVRWAARIGADSIDSALPLWSKENLAVFIDALGNKQTELPW